MIKHVQLTCQTLLQAIWQGGIQHSAKRTTQALNSGRLAHTQRQLGYSKQTVAVVQWEESLWTVSVWIGKHLGSGNQLK